jgi:GxxExxY protein
MFGDGVRNAGDPGGVASGIVAAKQDKNRPLQKLYVPDFLCFGEVIVEIKAVQDPTDMIRAQVLNDLTATKKRLSILVNFNHHSKLEYERLVN